MQFGSLTKSELDFTRIAVEELRTVEWAQPLVRTLDASGMKAETMPFMFEARFAYAIHRAGHQAQYEYATGIGNSSVDFRMVTKQEWLIELVSIGESDASKAATVTDGVWHSHTLRSPRPSSTDIEKKQSTEGEMLLAEQKISSKVFDGRRPIKFPLPENRYHMIFADMRNYLNGGDLDDYTQISWGYRAVRQRLNVLCWPDARSGRMQPIRGLFEKENPLVAAKHVQERVHFLAFIAEDGYYKGEISKRIRIFANPCLFKDMEDVQTALNTFPLDVA